MAEPPPVLRVPRSRADLLPCYLKSGRTEVYDVLPPSSFLLPPFFPSSLLFRLLLQLVLSSAAGLTSELVPSWTLGLVSCCWCARARCFCSHFCYASRRDSPSLGARPWWSQGRGRKPLSGCQFACGSCPRPHHRTFQRWRVSRAERRCLGCLTRGRLVVVVVGRPAATCSSVASQHFGADVPAARSAIGQTWMRGDRGQDVPSVLPASSSSYSLSPSAPHPSPAKRSLRRGRGCERIAVFTARLV